MSAVKRKPGRPALAPDQRAVRAQVSLDQATIDQAREMGEGKLSAGIRRAVAAAWTLWTPKK